MASLDRGPNFNLCLVQHLAGSIGELKSELYVHVVDITRGLSMLENNDATL